MMLMFIQLFSPAEFCRATNCHGRNRLAVGYSHFYRKIASVNYFLRFWTPKHGVCSRVSEKFAAHLLTMRVDHCVLRKVIFNDVDLAKGFGGLGRKR
jgi:hypothetical protein